KKIYGVSEVLGTQLSAPAQEFAQHRLGLNVKPARLPDCYHELPKFSLITAWHVFEHVADYQEYFRLSEQLLIPGGSLIIEVPNANCWTARLCRAAWMGWDPPHHVVHFTPAGLKKLLAANGLELVSINTFSLEYSLFTSLQSICNCFSRSRNAFFDALRQ